MEKMQKKALVIGLVFVVILNLFVIVWLVSDLFAGKEENPKGTVSSTEEITTEENTAGETTTEEPTTEEPTTEEPTTEETTTEELTTQEPATEETTTEAVVIEPGNIHTEETVADTGEIMQVIEIGKTLLVDLDGDGVEEKITLRTETERDRYDHNSIHFQVNDLYYHGGKFAELVPGGWLGVSKTGFSLVDLDKSDNFKEIVIYESNMDPICFLRYQDGALIPIGTIPGNSLVNSEKLDFLTIPGDGTVSIKVNVDLMYTYITTKTWKLVNAKSFHASLEEVKPEFYEIDSQSHAERLWVCQEMTFYAEMNGNIDNLVTLPSGTLITMARYYPEDGWIQFLCEQDGKVVWVKYMKKLILPMNILDEEFKLNYTQLAAVAG